MTDTISRNDYAATMEGLAKGEPAWLGDARRRALSLFESLPTPPRSQHLWRYTGPEQIAPEARVPAAPGSDPGEIPPEFQDATYGNAAGYALGRDGIVLRTAMDPAVDGKGVLVMDILRAAREHEELVKDRLFSLVDTCDGSGAKFDHLSAALFTGGAFVHVPRGVAVERPIKIAQRYGGGELYAARSLIALEESADATVVIDTTSLDAEAASMIHEALEVDLAPNSRLRLVTVQRLGRAVTHAPIIRARLGRDARFETVSVALGCNLVKSLQTASLEGEGSEVSVLGLVFGDKRRHFDHHTFQDHVARNTRSDLDYRTVSGGRSRSAYTGRLRISLDAHGAEAHQKNHNLLLSKKARADTIPELEILTNDVVASHAATVGPIDEDQLFYCVSRGFSPEDARRTIVLGFLEPAIALIAEETLREKVRQAIDERLGGVRG